MTILLQKPSVLNTTSNTVSVTQVPAYPNGIFVVDLDASTGSVRGENVMMPDLPPDHLAFARHDGRANIFLHFSDGHAAKVDLTSLGIDVSRLNMNTAGASAEGSAVEIADANGKTVHIDSAVLRSYCDPRFAAELRQAIADANAD
jgi:hypothetical protein